MGKNTWLSMHPRNFCSDKIRPFMLADVKCFTTLKVQSIDKSCQLDIGHPCYGQLTAVKIGNPLTVANVT